VHTGQEKAVGSLAALAQLLCVTFLETGRDVTADLHSSIPTVGFNMKRVQKGHVTLKW
jgi:hypothetical protein